MLKLNLKTRAVAAVVAGACLISSGTSAFAKELNEEFYNTAGVKKIQKFASGSYQLTLKGKNSQEQLDVLNSDIQCLDNAINQINSSRHFTQNTCISTIQKVLARGLGYPLALASLAGVLGVGYLSLGDEVFTSKFERAFGDYIERREAVRALEKDALKPIEAPKNSGFFEGLTKAVDEFKKVHAIDSERAALAEAKTQLKTVAKEGAIRMLPPVAALIGAAYGLNKLGKVMGADSTSIYLSPEEAKDALSYLEGIKAALVDLREQASQS